MAKKQTDIPQQPTPVSGERVKMPPARSTYNKPPKPLSEAESAAMSDATAARKSWERSEVGRARTRDMTQLVGGGTVGQIYDAARRAGHDPQSSVGPTHYDVQLPGMADPHAAPRPPKWEELPPEQRAHTERSLAMRGTSIRQMTSDFGAQHDQAVHRAWTHGQSVPYATDFYSTGEPRQVVERSARELGIPPLIHAHMNAMTSPNTKFSQLSHGQVVYPNDRAARHVVKYVQQGGEPAELTNELRLTGEAPAGSTERAQGYVTNMRKAASSFKQFTEGVQPADWVTGKHGGGPFDSSPKTGPYSNSWNDTHPQFTVSDVHTGGGGFLPHLSSDKPMLFHESGERQTRMGMRYGEEHVEVKRDKSEREKAIEQIPNFHSAADYAARQAMTQRGLRSTREAQAAQWGEEQLQRGDDARKRGLSPGSFPKEAQVYGRSIPAPNEHQQRLF